MNQKEITVVVPEIPKVNLTAWGEKWNKIKKPFLLTTGLVCGILT